jgi:hypothetical protein
MRLKARGSFLADPEQVEVGESAVADELRGFNASLKHLEQLCLLIDYATMYDVNENPLGYRQNLKHLWMRSRWHLDSVERAKGQKDWEVIKGMKCLVNSKTGTIEVDELLPELLDKFFEWLQGRLHKHEVTYSKRALKEMGLMYQKKIYGMQ